MLVSAIGVRGALRAHLHVTHRDEKTRVLRIPAHGIIAIIDSGVWRMAAVRGSTRYRIGARQRGDGRRWYGRLAPCGRTRQGQCNQGAPQYSQRVLPCCRRAMQARDQGAISLTSLMPMLLAR
jgi:hypothetical protein